LQLLAALSVEGVHLLVVSLLAALELGVLA